MAERIPGTVKSGSAWLGFALFIVCARAGWPYLGDPSKPKAQPDPPKALDLRSLSAATRPSEPAAPSWPAPKPSAQAASPGARVPRPWRPVTDSLEDIVARGGAPAAADPAASGSTHGAPQKLFGTPARLPASGAVLASVNDLANRPPSKYDALIADVLPLYLAGRDREAVRGQPDPVAAVASRKPVETSTWRGLVIGEFESDPAFKVRQDNARAAEAEQFRAALAKWQAEMERATAARRGLEAQARLIAGRDTRPKLVAYGAEKPLGELVPIKAKLALDLPTFDRRSMSFDGVPLALAAQEAGLRSRAETFGRFAYGPASLRIKFKDLDAARRFKEDAAKGAVTLALWGEPRLDCWQSPIVVKAGYAETVTDPEAVAKNLGKGLLAYGLSALAGADPQQTRDAVGMATFGDKLDKVVERPAETRPGVLFQFGVDVVAVAAVLDGQGKPWPDVEVELLNRPRSCVRVVGVAPGGDTPIRMGDEILSVAGRPMPNASAWAATVGEQAVGDSYEMVVRSAVDGRERRHAVRRAASSGLSVVTAFPSR